MKRFYSIGSLLLFIYLNSWSTLMAQVTTYNGMGDLLPFEMSPTMPQGDGDRTVQFCLKAESKEEGENGIILALAGPANFEQPFVIGTQQLGEEIALWYGVHNKNFLSPGESLRAGEKLISANGKYQLIMQTDGNLVIYDENGTPIWASGTQYKGQNYQLLLQDDGNLVLYGDSPSAYNAAKWSSGTWTGALANIENKPVKAVLQNDGVLILRNAANQIVWTNKRNQITPEPASPVQERMILGTIEDTNWHIVTVICSRPSEYVRGLTPPDFRYTVECYIDYTHVSRGMVFNQGQKPISEVDLDPGDHHTYQGGLPHHHWWFKGQLDNLKLWNKARLPEAYYTWPTYKQLSYDFKTEYASLKPPTKVLPDDFGLVDTVYVLTKEQLPEGVESPWWCFRVGEEGHDSLPDSAIVPMLQRYEKDFAYFRNSMGVPPDKRALKGYYSTIDLLASGLSDNHPKTGLGGWSSSKRWDGSQWPLVILSYYPVRAFAPDYRKKDSLYQRGACIHEGMHNVLNTAPGCRKASWFHEGGNNVFLGVMHAQRTGEGLTDMGWASKATMVAPFMPIECYSGWLQDGSFGGPSAQGVNVLDSNGKKICNWRNLLGANQYSEAFGFFIADKLSERSLSWVWKYATGTVIDGLAKGQPDSGSVAEGLGEEATRRFVMEFRSRSAFCDFGARSPAYKKMRRQDWGITIKAEGNGDIPGVNVNPDLPIWKAYAYAQTTSDSTEMPTLTPDSTTLPGWTGANEIPLKLTPGRKSVSLNFNPVDLNMRCQLVYRTTEGDVVYSDPIEDGRIDLYLPKAVKNNVIIAVISNTDYTYVNDETRKKKYQYTVQLVSGLSGAADHKVKWFEK